MDLRLLLMSVFLVNSEAYRILIIAHMPVKSLNILGEGYVRHLHAAGHDVTYMSVYPFKNKPENRFRQIDLNSNIGHMEHDELLNISVIIGQPANEDTDMVYIQDEALNAAVVTFENENVKKFLADPNEQFDVVISDFSESELFGALGALYDCPMIWSYSMGPHWLTLRLVDETTNPAYATDYLTPDIPPFLSMYQRIKKMWTQTKWLYRKWATIKPQEEAFYRQYFNKLFALRNKPLPDYNDIIYNSSLVLSNDFPGNGLMPSVPQNFKFVGGYHITTPPNPLTGEIETLLDNAKHGFIYFSMGSVWESKDIPKEVTRGLLEIFEKLNETVIWKYEEDLADVPKNVHILKWVPQTGVLAHPNILIFITHGGQLSSTEAVHFGVPLIGVPIYFDQFANINRAVSRGSAIRVGLTFDLPKNLGIAIYKMLSDPTYKQKAKEVSMIYHDRVVPPGKELVHWVEHAVRTRGAPHLRSPAALMPWYQKMFLDAIAIVLAIVFLLVIVTNRIISLCRNKKVKRN